MEKDPDTGAKILIVDDNLRNLQLLAQILKRDGYKIYIASNGEKALSTACRGRPDLILLDILMPDMNGIEVCRRLKSKEPFQDIPILFISALTETREKVQGFQAGGVDYITKPFQAEEVLSRVETHLKLKGAREQLRAAKEEAEKANRIKSAFLANISHEIRTPMNAIMAMAELLGQAELPVQQQDQVRTIRDAADMLLSLINNVLDLSKLESGRMELDHRVFSLPKTVNHVVDMFRLQAEKKGLDLSIISSDSLPEFLKGDPGRLRQVLVNLLDNALKFTETGGITLNIDESQIETEGRVTLLFSVSDTGPGIPEDQIPNLFQPFTQLDASTTRKHSGSGLGLAISKQFVRMMDGDMGIRSQPGQGVTFWFQVALEKAEEPQEDWVDHAREEEDQCLARDSGICLFENPPRVLVAEDDAINQKVIGRLLDNLGVPWDLAGDGADAVRLLKKGHYGLILMDIRMPEMDGVEATGAIRNPATGLPDPEIPVIALTANVRKGDRERYEAAGMNDYLAKPVRLSQLTRILRRHLIKEPEKIGGTAEKPPFPADGREAGGVPCPAVDQNRLDETFGGDEALMKDVLAMFSEDVPVMMDKIRAAIDAEDPVAVSRHAHSLKGAAAMFGAIGIRDHARAIEDAGKAGDLKTAFEVLERLKEEVNRI